MQSSEFCARMTAIWDGKCKPDGNGGIIVYGHPDYDEWHNAHKVAKAEFGAVKLYQGNSDGTTYKFKDGSRAGVKISEVTDIGFATRGYYRAA